jgi:hypothetical protein
MKVVIIPVKTFLSHTGRLQIFYIKCIHPHSSSANILNGKLLLLFWIKGNITKHSFNQ